MAIAKNVNQNVKHCSFYLTDGSLDFLKPVQEAMCLFKYLLGLKGVNNPQKISSGEVFVNVDLSQGHSLYHITVTIFYRDSSNSLVSLSDKIEAQIFVSGSYPYYLIRLLVWYLMK